MVHDGIFGMSGTWAASYMDMFCDYESLRLAHEESTAAQHAFRLALQEVHSPLPLEGLTARADGRVVGDDISFQLLIPGAATGHPCDPVVHQQLPCEIVA